MTLDKKTPISASTISSNVKVSVTKETSDSLSFDGVDDTVEVK